MTNAEKYLKDGVDVENFANGLCGFVENWELRNGIKNFLKKEAKPTLTEDERVILRNIKEHNKIGREETGDLYVQFSLEGYEETTYINPFRHLFQFIKDGEEYSIEELLK